MSSNISKFALLASRLTRLAISNRRGFREICGVALASSSQMLDPEADVLPIPVCSLEDLIAEASEPLPLAIHAFPSVRFSISVLEAMTLATLMRKVRAKKVFEFGTHRGVSTSQLAVNLQPDGIVYTLDLPPDDRSTTYGLASLPGDLEVSKFPTKGDMIPEHLRAKVKFLTGDSAKFDPAPYAGTMDFIFIDAAHTTEYVTNDTEKAWVMLRPGGVMAWHDCRPETPDVVKYLRGCRFKPKRVFNTTIAFATKPT